MFLKWGGKPENPEKTHRGIGRLQIGQQVWTQNLLAVRRPCKRLHISVLLSDPIMSIWSRMAKGMMIQTPCEIPANSTQSCPCSIQQTRVDRAGGRTWKCSHYCTASLQHNSFGHKLQRLSAFPELDRHFWRQLLPTSSHSLIVSPVRHFYCHLCLNNLHPVG